MTEPIKEKRHVTADLGEIVLYQSEDGTSTLDVHLKDETVWLNQAQMVELFQRTKQNISLHIRKYIQQRRITGEFSSQGILDYCSGRQTVQD